VAVVIALSLESWPDRAEQTRRPAQWTQGCYEAGEKSSPDLSDPPQRDNATGLLDRSALYGVVWPVLRDDFPVTTRPRAWGWVASRWLAISPESGSSRSPWWPVASGAVEQRVGRKPSQRELARLAQASNFKTREAKHGALDVH
jgi:hypothetical protein